MVYKPSVRYWYKDPYTLKYVRVKYICFSNLCDRLSDRKFNIDSIKYVIATSLPIKNLRAYLSFVGTILCGQNYKYRIFKLKKMAKIRYIHLSLNVKNMSFNQALLYLTCFRYVQEFPEIIENFLLKSKNSKTIEDRFYYFQKSHNEAIIGDIYLKYDNLAGHGLMYKFGIFDPILLKDFNLNLKNNNIKTVHAYFNS